MTSFSIISWPEGCESSSPRLPPPSPSPLPFFLPTIPIYNPSFPFRSTLWPGTLFPACIIPSQLFRVYFKHFGGLSLDGNLINGGVCNGGTIAAGREGVERNPQVWRGGIGGSDVCDPRVRPGATCLGSPWLENVSVGRGTLLGMGESYQEVGGV